MSSAFSAAFLVGFLTTWLILTLLSRRKWRARLHDLGRIRREIETTAATQVEIQKRLDAIREHMDRVNADLRSGSLPAAVSSDGGPGRTTA